MRAKLLIIQFWIPLSTARRNFNFSLFSLTTFREGQICILYIWAILVKRLLKLFQNYFILNQKSLSKAHSAFANTLNTKFKELIFDFRRKQNSLKFLNPRELNFPTKICFLFQASQLGWSVFLLGCSLYSLEFHSHYRVSRLRWSCFLTSCPSY